MKYFHLPLFLTLLAVKNAESWMRILFALFGVYFIMTTLVVLNSIFGGLLYFEMREYQDLRSERVHEEQLLEDYRQFWQKVHTEFPTHRTAIEAERILKTQE